MQQVEIFLRGERDYSLIKGDTGPVVYVLLLSFSLSLAFVNLILIEENSYPAGFVYVYSGLYYLTNGGKDIRLAQYAFAGIYVVTLGMVFTLYKRCGSVSLLPCLSLELEKDTDES